MKLVKKALFLLGVIVSIVALVLVGTAMVQIGMEIVAGKMGIAITEDFLFSVSGSCGIAVAALVCAGYVKRKKYTECVVTEEKFHMVQAVFYMVLSVCVCKILLNSVITLLCAKVFPVTGQMQGSSGNMYVDMVFAIIVAPIMEELLFRMGIYSLLRRRFSRVSAIGICAFGFAIVHGYQIQGFLSCLAAGFVFTWIYDSTGNIWYSIGAHMFCNLFVSVMNSLESANVTWFGVELQYMVNGYNTYHPLIIAAAFAFCGACLARVYKQRVSRGTLQGN